MVKFRGALFVLVLVGLLTAAAPASAQVNANGFSFGTTFITSAVDDTSRILLTVFGFHADNSGFSFIDVKCPVFDPRNLLAEFCRELQPGDELEAMSGGAPDPFSDNPTHHILRSITEGNPVVVSLPGGLGLEPSFLDTESWPADAVQRALRPKVLGVTRDVVAA